MAKRRKFSRWRRLPGVYRFGDEKAPDPNLEPQRLSLYISGVSLDRAEAQANRLGYENLQVYCGELLVRAIDAEHVRDQVAGVEAKRGALEGLHEIADDPEYLAELSAAASASATSRDPQAQGPSASPATPDRPGTGLSALTFRLEGVTENHREPGFPAPDHRGRPGPSALSPAAEVILRHAGQWQGDSGGFLPSLRRGDPVPSSEVGELAQALHELEREYRQASTMDRRLTFALHRLAFESQILHTDAYPGSFDVWTVDMLRAVQEAVERILSGQDIRYGSPAEGLDLSPIPENPN